MRLPNISLLAAAALVLGACAAFDRGRQPARFHAVRCDLAADEGVALTKRKAAALAEEGARNQVGDVRGFLIGMA